MLPVPSASVMPAARCGVELRGAERWTVNASGVSKTASFNTVMVMVAVVGPARMVTVPSVAPVKSVPATALPLTGCRRRCPRRRPPRQGDGEGDAGIGAFGRRIGRAVGNRNRRLGLVVDDVAGAVGGR